MAKLKINTGELPSAEGLDGYELAVVVGKWQAIAYHDFRRDCKDLLKIIDETERLRLWEKNCGGFTYKSRDDFLQNKVLIDYDLTEQSLFEIVARLRGEHVGPDAYTVEAELREPTLTPLESLLKAWGKASEEERAKFLDAIKTNFESGFLEVGR